MNQATKIKEQMQQSRQDFLKSRKNAREIEKSFTELARIRKKSLSERLLKNFEWGNKTYSLVITLIVLGVIILQLLDIPLLKTIGWIILCVLFAVMTLISLTLRVSRPSIFADKQQGGECIVAMYERYNEMASNSEVVIQFSTNDKYALKDTELGIEDNQLIFHTPYGRKAYKLSSLDKSDVEEFVETFDNLKEESEEDEEDEWEEIDEDKDEEDEEESECSQSRATQEDTQSYQTPESMQKVLEQMAMTMADCNSQLQHTLFQQSKLDKYDDAYLRYAHKERDNAFMEVFQLSAEEFEKLTPKDFEDFQELLDSTIIKCVEALAFEDLSFEVNLTQAFAKNISTIPRCEVKLFVPLSNEENQRTIGFNTKDSAQEPSIKPNRTFFFNLLNAGANVDMGLVEQARELFIEYTNAHSERIDYYNSDNEEWERRYYDSQVEEEYLDSHPVVKMLQEMMLALQTCLYAPKLSRTEVLNELDKEVRLSSWNMPQVAEYFVYNQGELIGYKRQEFEKNTQVVDVDSAIASLQSVLESGEKAFLLGDDDVLDSRLDTESTDYKDIVESMEVLESAKSYDEEKPKIINTKGDTMEDLENLQKRWNEAYEAMPKLYETSNGLIVNFTLSEDTDTILFKEPWENFELEDDEEAEWRISFFSISEDKPLGYLEYKEALEKLQDYALMQSEERILIKAISLEELKALGLKDII